MISITPGVIISEPGVTSEDDTALRAASACSGVRAPSSGLPHARDWSAEVDVDRGAGGHLEMFASHSGHIPWLVCVPYLCM